MQNETLFLLFPVSQRPFPALICLIAACDNCYWLLKEDRKSKIIHL